jgi:hypothetical protein
MLTLIERAGDLATKDIWHSTVQIITNYPDLHEYAARKVSCAAGTFQKRWPLFNYCFLKSNRQKSIIALTYNLPLAGSASCQI